MGIYMDNASTTKICEAAKNVMINYINDFGNPSSAHELGRQARVLIEDARERIAKATYDVNVFGRTTKKTIHPKLNFSSSLHFSSISVESSIASFFSLPKKELMLSCF